MKNMTFAEMADMILRKFEERNPDLFIDVAYNLAGDTLQGHQDDRSEAQATTHVCFDTVDCMTCELAEECAARMLVECPFSDAVDALSEHGLELAGTFSPRWD